MLGAEEGSLESVELCGRRFVVGGFESDRPRDGFFDVSPLRGYVFFLSFFVVRVVLLKKKFFLIPNINYCTDN